MLNSLFHSKIKKSAFTLIEILIVIIVVGVLASIAVPSYYHMVEGAKKDIARSGLRLIYTGEKMYFADNKSYTSNMQDLLKYIEIPDSSDYNYSILTASETDFTAQAKRGATILTIDATGVINDASESYPTGGATPVIYK